jgi:HTH-type transcriptional regulator / antitoxin HigA
MIKKIQNEYWPDFVTPLGDTLEETLEAKGMTRIELASQMGCPLNTIDEIIAGTVAVTLEIAIQLEQALGVPASFWNNRERRYRESLAKKQVATVAARA